LIALEAPKLWTETRLDEVADIVRDIVDPFNIANGTTYVGLEHMESSGDFVGVGPVSNGELASAKFRFSPEHVLFGKLRPYLRKVARPTFSGVCSTDILPIKPKPGISRDYLYHYLRHPRITEEATLRCAGANLPRLSPSQLESFPFLVPFPDDPRRSLAEQKRIAAILDKADAIRRRRQEAARLADTLIPSVFYEMFGDPVLNRKGWPTRPLGEMLDFLTSGSRGWAAFYANSGRMFLRIQNVGRNRLLLDDVQYVQVEDSAESRRTATQPGDVLVTVTADLGRTAVIPEGFGPAHINQHIVLLRSTQIEPLFLSQFLASPAGQRQFIAKNRAAVKAGLNFDDIKSVKIVTPPRPLQKKFADACLRIERFAADLVSREEATDSLFNALVQRAFRGEL
jgi:type I restriction enzyme S subunit